MKAAGYVPDSATIARRANRASHAERKKASLRLRQLPLLER